MADVNFKCSHCYQPLSATDDMRGQLIDCPKCGQTVEVPANVRPGVLSGDMSWQATASKPRPSIRPPQLSTGSRERIIYILLGLFLGSLGIHNFYAGRTGEGVAQLLITLFLGWLYGIGFLIVFIWVISEICTVTVDGAGVPFK